MIQEQPQTAHREEPRLFEELYVESRRKCVLINKKDIQWGQAVKSLDWLGFSC